MNRLEHLSEKFMSRKSNTSVDSPALQRAAARKVEQPETKYDWRANLDARKKERAACKENDEIGSASPRDRRRALQGQANRLGRVSLDNRSDRNKIADSDRNDKLSSTTNRSRLLENNRDLRPSAVSSPSSRRRREDNHASSDNALPTTRQGRLAAMSSGRRF